MRANQRKGRVLNGLLLLDKPAGITSNLALRKVKKLFNAAKAGHTGSLDPLATGMLIICFGKATKISNYLLNADKQYEVTLQLGVTTDTGDADGNVLKTKDASLVTDEAIIQSKEQLTGVIDQIPPMFSAIKHHGTRLHKLARQGIEVERRSRTVHIYKFDLITRQGDCLAMHVHCSKGTYVRSLVEDLGKKLGCGAHVINLRRTSIGPFVDSKLPTLSELQHYAEQQPSLLDNLLISTDSALQDYPAVSVAEKTMQKVQNGLPIWVEGAPSNGLVRIYDEQDNFYGVGNVLEDGRIAPKCLS